MSHDLNQYYHRTMGEIELHVNMLQMPIHQLHTGANPEQLQHVATKYTAFQPFSAVHVGIIFPEQRTKSWKDPVHRSK